MYAQYAQASAEARRRHPHAAGSFVTFSSTVTRSWSATSRWTVPASRVHAPAVSPANAGDTAHVANPSASANDAGRYTRASNRGAPAGRTSSYQIAAFSAAAAPYTSATAGTASRIPAAARSTGSDSSDRHSPPKSSWACDTTTSSVARRYARSAARISSHTRVTTSRRHRHIRRNRRQRRLGHPTPRNELTHLDSPLRAALVSQKLHDLGLVIAQSLQDQRRLGQPRHRGHLLHHRIRGGHHRRRRGVLPVRFQPPQLIWRLGQAVAQHDDVLPCPDQTRTKRRGCVGGLDNQVFLRRINRLGGVRVVLHDAQRPQRKRHLTSEPRGNHPQMVVVRLERYLLELVDLRQLTVLIASDSPQPPDDRQPLRDRGPVPIGEHILIRTEERTLRGGKELRRHLCPQHGTHSFISDRHDRPRDPRTPERAVKVRSVNQRLHEHPPDRVPPPRSRPTTPSRPHDVPHPIRQVHHHLGRHTLRVHIRHRQRSPQRTSRSIPQTSPVHPRPCLHQNLRLPRLSVTVRHREERNRVNQRRCDRLRQLHAHLVIREHRRQPVRVLLVTRQYKPVKHDPVRQRINSLRRPPHNSLDRLQLRRNSDPKIPQPVLPVVIRHPQLVTPHLVSPLVQKRPQQVQVGAIHRSHIHVSRN